MSLLDVQSQNVLNQFNFKLDFSDPTKLPNYNEVAKDKRIVELEETLKAINYAMITFYLKISPEYDAAVWEEEKERLLHYPPMLIFEYITSTYTTELDKANKKQIQEVSKKGGKMIT